MNSAIVVPRHGICPSHRTPRSPPFRSETESRVAVLVFEVDERPTRLRGFGRGRIVAYQPRQHAARRGRIAAAHEELALLPERRRSLVALRVACHDVAISRDGL